MNYIEYRSIDSTNNEAKRLISDGKITAPTCLTAKEQTAGRGRQGKSFFSPDTGLYMTVVFPVDFPISSQVTMTTRTACAVAAAIEECTGKAVGIKWVNDIYIDGKKCCGILCEAVNDYEQGRMKFVVIGIGINIYTKEWPDDLKDIAGSLFNQRDGSLIDFNRRTVPVIENLRNRIAETLGDWLFKTSNEEFLSYYKDHSIVLGKKITFIENGESREGTAVDIDETGGLVVEVRNKSIEKVEDGTALEKSLIVLSSGEISVRI